MAPSGRKIPAGPPPHLRNLGLAVSLFLAKWGGLPLGFCRLGPSAMEKPDVGLEKCAASRNYWRVDRLAISLPCPSGRLILPDARFSARKLKRAAKRHSAELFGRGKPAPHCASLPDRQRIPPSWAIQRKFAMWLILGVGCLPRSLHPGPEEGQPSETSTGFAPCKCVGPQLFLRLFAIFALSALFPRRNI